MSDDKRSSLITAASTCFSSKGFTATTIAEIARAADVGKGTVYEYFPSKEALLVTCCLDACAATEAAISQELGLDDAGVWPIVTDGAALAAIGTIVQTIITGLLTISSDQRILFNELAVVALSHPDVTSEARVSLATTLERWTSRFAALQQVGIDAGVFRASAATTDSARVLLTMLDGLLWPRTWLPDESIPDLAHRMARTWLLLNATNPDNIDALT
ncbi:MAG: TetR/AcrR family transcriptional regulator [Planctomycetota bacterium]